MLRCLIDEAYTRHPCPHSFTRYPHSAALALPVV